MTRVERRRRWRFVNRVADSEPFELYMSALCVVSGIPLILAGASPNTLERTLPPIVVTLWGFELSVGGLMTVTGLFLTGTRAGYRLERSGLGFLAAAATVYAVVLLFVAWPSGLVVVALLAGFVAACLRRRRSMGRTTVIHTKGG